MSIDLLDLAWNERYYYEFEDSIFPQSKKPLVKEEYPISLISEPRVLYQTGF